MDLDSGCQESTTITFEWTLRGLKNIFESTRSSKGDSKSKVTKSVRFGGGRWQILFYANAGPGKDSTAEAGFVSLYLSCEPTTEEKESALSNGKWVRDGVYKFSFELRNIGKTVLYNLKEAHNHTFSHQTANWGWAQFSRRDSVFHAVKVHDAFVIICTITSSPSTPLPPPGGPRQFVPKGLLDTVGSLLDDPTYSDVEFVIPSRGRRMKNARKISACRQLLKRVEYFDAMFSSGFAEGSTDSDEPTLFPGGNQAQSNGTNSLIMDDFEDSDDEHDNVSDDSFAADSPQSSAALEIIATSVTEDLPEDDQMERQDYRNVQAKLSHPSSPRNNHFGLPSHQPELIMGPGKLKVVVKDVAYTTYRAVLYYIYTDTIVFAPLSSSFSSSNDAPSSTPPMTNLPSATPSEVQNNAAVNKWTSPKADLACTRPEWIAHWQVNNPGRPAPCSAKAVYRLADRLGIRELKERASQHILKSLTAENIAYEVFSPFAAAFDEIRKAQVDFFLVHWQDIRGSDSMRNVWQQIRNGRHPGFEEVWPVIAQSLEFKPPARNAARTVGEDVPSDD